MYESSILDTAIAAHNAGLCPIRAATNGSKRPYGEWKKFMGERPDMADIMAWFPKWPNLGLVCGAISDRLICVEFEGRFHDRGKVTDALTAAGLHDVWMSWLEGYTEFTPSGGIHILIHYGGDDPVPGNTKIALDSERETLIETRGEGGFIIVAPSYGPTHETGKPWMKASGGFDSIAWTTPEEYEAVLACLSQFDECPPQPAPPPPARPRLTLVGGESWIAEELTLLPPIEQCLEDNGWQYLRDEPKGSLWKRPGKTAPGHSARVNLSGRLHVFSSATQFPPGTTTYDTLDVVLGHALGRVPTRDERTEELRALRDQRLGGKFVWKHSEPRIDEPASDDLWLPPEFWSQRPVLQAIHDAAIGSMLSPEGVLGAFLSSYATTVPMSIKLPKVVGVPSPLNTYCALVAKSGGGKSTSMALALDLLGYGPRNSHVLLNRSLRSGEGLINLAIHGKGDAETGPIYNNAVQVVFDEGGTLSAQSSRTGSTTLSYLNTAWAGLNIVGGAKASESGSFPADLVRICAVMGVQFGVCANLFTGEAEFLGFPQRILFFGLENPVLRTIEVTADEIEDAKPVDVQFWEHAQYTSRITVPRDIIVEVRRWSLQRNAGDLHESLDSHRYLLQLRTAALFALMEDRTTISDSDWDISDAICATSRRVRSKLVRSIGDVSINRAKARGFEQNIQAEAADTAWIDGKARRLASKLIGEKDGLSRKELRGYLSSAEKPRLNEILEHAVACRLVVRKDDRYYGGGE